MAISSNTTGLRPGVCTSTSRPSSPYEGQMIYETDTDKTLFWNGSAWVNVNSVSPAFTGTPTAPTASAGTNTTQLATTAFVTTADNLKANLASPTFTGTPVAPTAAVNTKTTQIATTEFVMSSFRILQVVNNFTTGEIGRGSSTYADTGLTATITPRFSTSKILVLVSQNGLFKVNDTAMDLRLLRNGTGLCTFMVNGGLTSSALVLNFGGVSQTYLDSPATTSATTYKTQFRSIANIADVVVQYGSAMSTITLMEIAG